MRMMNRKAMAVALMACTVTACGDDAKRGDNDDRTAAGEVRGGTISDEMLPLDQLKSQSPPQRVSNTASGESESEDQVAEGEEAPSVDAAEPDPAETE